MGALGRAGNSEAFTGAVGRVKRAVVFDLESLFATQHGVGVMS